MISIPEPYGSVSADLSKFNLGTALLIAAPFLILFKPLRNITVGAAAVVILYSALEKVSTNPINLNIPTILNPTQTTPNATT